MLVWRSVEVITSLKSSCLTIFAGWCTESFRLFIVGYKENDDIHYVFFFFVIFNHSFLSFSSVYLPIFYLFFSFFIPFSVVLHSFVFLFFVFVYTHSWKFYKWCHRFVSLNSQHNKVTATKKKERGNKNMYKFCNSIYIFLLFFILTYQLKNV